MLVVSECVGEEVNESDVVVVVEVEPIEEDDGLECGEFQVGLLQCSCEWIVHEKVQLL